MIRRNSASRRQFLRGAGGFTLALPFLPSLVDPREARSAAAGAPIKRFIQFCTQHGGIWGANMYPGDQTLTDSMSYAGRTVKRGKLVPQPVAGGRAQLSAVLSGPASSLTSALAAKMNVLRGLDTSWVLGHHTGGHLGNFARTDGAELAAFPTPTIDQVMGWSPKFYPDLASIRQRVVVVGTKISYNWSNPSSQTDLGPVQEVAQGGDALSIFNQIFVNTGGSGAPDPNAALTPVVDRVLADYMRLRSANTRLSSDDRRRLDDHMQRMSELQRKLNVHTSCPSIMPPSSSSKIRDSDPTFYVNPVTQAQFYQTYNDVILAAILCDTSRISVVNILEDFSVYPGNWHNDVAHHAADPDGAKEAIILAAHQLTFEKVFLDLCSKLDVDDGSGKTYLDNSLVVWTQESGEYTHSGQGLPVVTAGSAGGFLNTGNYCDYRNPALIVDGGEQGNSIKIFGGLLWQQWLGTALQAMGLDRSDYEKNGLRGYPTATKFIDPSMAKAYTDDVWNAAGDVLPFLKA
jgi:hypothetical protein